MTQCMFHNNTGSMYLHIKDFKDFIMLYRVCIFLYVKNSYKNSFQAINILFS